MNTGVPKNTLLLRLDEQASVARMAVANVDDGSRLNRMAVGHLQEQTTRLCDLCGEAVKTVQDYQELISAVEEIINNEPKKSTALLVIRGLIEVKLHK